LIHFTQSYKSPFYTKLQKSVGFCYSKTSWESKISMLYHGLKIKW